MESYNFGVGRTLRIAFEFVTLAILLLVGSAGAVTPTITTHQPASPLDIIVGNTQNFTLTVGNQNVILNWFLNDNTLLANQTVNSSQVVTYSYKAATIGTYKITANISNDNGSNIQEWILNVHPTTYFKGNRIWDGSRPDLFSLSYTWDPMSFSGFYYNAKDDVGTENITIAMKSYSSTSIEKGKLTYSTTPQDVSFTYSGFGKYQVIGFMAEKYFAGYTDKTTPSKTQPDTKFDGISTVAQNQLHKVLIDDDIKRTISVGGTIALKEGYVLKEKDIDLKGKNLFLSLLKDGNEVDVSPLSAGETYVYSKTVGGVENLPLIIVRFDSVFSDQETQAAFLKGMFQISEDATKVETGNQFGNMEVTSANKDGIQMENSATIGLSKGTTASIMGDMKIIVANNNSVVRFALSVEKAGDFEVRSTVYENVTDPIMKWTPYNFGMNIGKTSIGFYYDLDDGVGNEKLTLLNKVSGRSIPDQGLEYSTTPQEVNFIYTGFGKYQVIGFMADKYFAGYTSNTKPPDPTTSLGEISTLANNNLHKVLIDDDTKRTISVGGTIALKEGYVLKATDIDLKGRTMLLSLLKDGSEVDTTPLSAGQTYVYAKKVGNTDNLPLIMVRIDNVSGQELQGAFLKGIFQISENPTSVKVTEEFGNMEVTSVTSNIITMSNNGSIGLDKNKNDTLMGNIQLKVADSDELRFYFSVDRTPEIIANRLAIDAPPKAKAGDTIRINVTAGGNAMDNASITLDTDIGNTDKDGNLTYTLPKNLNGTYNITATKTGYKKATRKIQIEKYSVATILTVNSSGRADYTKIQDAINNAMDGDTILVDSGTYFENVKVNKKLILRGIGNPVVDAGGSGSAITLSADGITLEGFTATGGGSYPEAGIKVTSSNNTLSSNNASSNKYNGIHLEFSSNNTLSGNDASSNKYNYYGNGISLYNFSNNTLSGNNASNNSNGISLSSSSNNTLSGNNVGSNNNNGIHLEFPSNNNTLSGNNASNNNNGISLESSSNNTLSGNNASNNDGYYGISLDSSSNNTLSGNNASNNGHGIHLEFSSNNNTLSGNNASNNYYDGIYLDSSSNNTLSGNNVSNNWNGIYLDSSSNNTLSGNNVGSNNNFSGISLDSSSNNTISDNNASNNNNGIGLWSSSNNTLSGNNASNNDGAYGIYLYSSSNNTLSGNNASNNNNGIHLEFSSNNNTMSGNNASSNNNVGIYLSFSSKNTLSGNNASSNNWNGISLVSSSKNTLSGNNASNNGHGISLSLSSNNTLNGNMMTGNQENFYLDGDTDSDFDNQIDTTNLVDGKPIYYIIKASDTTYDSSSNAGILYCISCVNVTIKNLNLNKNGNGIYFRNTSQSRIQNVNASNTGDNGGGYGILLYSSSNNTLSGNNASSNNGGGIYLFDSSNNTLGGNNASNNYYDGISLESSSNNTLSGNNVSNNDGYYGGISLDSSSNNTLSGNNVLNNIKGISLWYSNNNTLNGNNASSNNNDGIILGSSSNNKIYNNIFNNTYNFYSDSNNAWNTTRQSGTNIIGGTYLGGNFWANPNGTGFSQTCKDGNGDGICDQSYILDAKNIDYLPISMNFTKDKIPPKSVSKLKNITYTKNYINWTWKDPKDIDFKKVMVFIDNNFKKNVSKGKRFYNATNFEPNTKHTISTWTVDVNGNINKTWANRSAWTAK